MAELLSARAGHFVFESGHHGNLWLELDALCLRPTALRPFIMELARWARDQRAEIICGPLMEGAFVALMVAEELALEFVYAERIEPPPKSNDDDRLFPVQYRLPASLRATVCGRRVAIVNDVINAGSAVRGAAFDLTECGAEPVGIACLMTLGNAATEFARECRVPLFQLAAREMNLWTPQACPLCQAGVPIDN